MPDEHGNALTVFVAVSVVGLLAVCGLVVDGGAQARLGRQAELVAAQAARAAVDNTATNRVAGVRTDAAAAIAAARQVLAGHPELSSQVRLVGDAVQVSTSGQVETVFLSLIGIPTLAAHGSATADLIPDR